MKNTKLPALRRTRRRSTSGFTLMEVVIALAILAFALFGAISVITYTTRMNMATRERMLAVRAAEKKIEQMLSCASFDDIYNLFKNQVEGFGWEQVEGLEPVDPAPLSPPPDVVPVTYTYPTWTNKLLPPPRRPVLFVRFPLNDTGTAFDESKGGNVKYQGSGVFSDSYQMDSAGKFILDAGGKKIPIDLDFNGNGSNTNSILVSDISTLKILPVSIEVYWKGSVGPNRGNVGNTYLIYKYTFLRKT